MGINRGPAGVLAYLLLHTSTPSLAAAFALVRAHDAHRGKARTERNTFAAELAMISAGAGKPLQ